MTALSLIRVVVIASSLMSSPVSVWFFTRRLLTAPGAIREVVIASSLMSLPWIVPSLMSELVIWFAATDVPALTAAISTTAKARNPTRLVRTAGIDGNFDCFDSLMERPFASAPQAVHGGGYQSGAR